MRPFRRPSAFTLLELLVVLGVIGLLVGLLLPAVQRVREAASRLSCQNNMKQLALACHNYHSSHGVLPPGGIGPNRPSSQLPSSSWLLQLTPFVEQQAVWDRAVSDYANPAVQQLSHHRGPKTILNAFLCPSDSRLRTLQLGKYYRTFHDAAFVGYVGVSGVNQFTRDGLLYIDSAVRLEHVSDGASNTILIGERTPNFVGDRGVWYTSSGTDPDVLLGAREVVVFQYYTNCAYGPYHYGPGGLANPCDDYHYWSLHAGGANFAFGDGSVRFLKYSAADILPALATRAGGEIVTVPD